MVAFGLAGNENREDLGRVAPMPTFRVLLTSADLQKIRLLPTVDPIDELVAAAHEFAARRDDPMWGGWTRRTVTALGSMAAPVLSVMNSGYVQISTAPTGETIGRNFDDALDSVLSGRVSDWRETVDALAEEGVDPGPIRAIADGQPGALAQYGAVLHRFHSAAMAPYLPRVSSRISAVRDGHLRVLAEEGVDRLLNELHPGITWRFPWLTIRKKEHKTNCAHNVVRSNTPGGDIVRGLGRGLNLQPSIFAEDPCLKVAGDDYDMPVQLNFPVPIDWKLLTDPADDIHRDPLGDLMGTTRASVLQALQQRQHTTSSLAKALHVSAATASEHAAVLRAAHLVTTTRQGNHVMHDLSPLGLTLVHSAGC